MTYSLQDKLHSQRATQTLLFPRHSNFKNLAYSRTYIDKGLPININLATNLIITYKITALPLIPTGTSTQFT